MLRQLTDQEKWDHFKRDWAAYQKTREYKALKEAMERAGVKHPYSENIIHRSYWAGYFKKPFISDIHYAETDRFIRSSTGQK